MTECLDVSANKYQELAMRTSDFEDASDQLLHGVFGLTAEAGEVASIFQKMYQGHEWTKAHLVKECGDCLWMITEILTSIGVSLSDCMAINIDKLSKRYPDGFEIEKSLNRAEGDD